ncbi:MAG: DNA polymerase Y family protein [Acidobacteriaceae bacterium]
MREQSEIYACLYVKDFPTQALLRLRPELRNKPCVVMEGEPPREEVCSLTRKAHGLGLARGMTRVEVDTFPEVTVLERSLKEEAGAREILLECAGCYSPRVEDSSDGLSFLCVLDIAGTTALIGSPETLARNLLARISALGITACVAVSSNFHAAIAVAKGPLPLSVRVIPPGEESTALAALPLTVLDLTEEQAEIFALWGIGTLGMLAALPEKELISRVGQTGKRLRQMARGEAPHLFQPIEPAFTLRERMELDSPVEVLDALMFVANLMLEQLVLRAMARALSLASVTIALTLEGDAIHTRTIRPALPTNDRQLWLKLLHLDLEAHPPQAAILAVELNADPGNTSQVQLGLFSPQLPEPSRLDVTLARIRTIVGDENVGRAVLTDTHRLDGFRMEPFSISSTESSGIAFAPPRPAMRRLRPAEAVSVTLQGERPKAFTLREQRYSVERAYGPWLMSGEWWTSTRWGCEQWDLAARTYDGATLCVCLIRDLLRNQWQMVGLYD